MKKLMLLILLMICVVSFSVPAFGNVDQNGVFSDAAPPPKD